MAKSKLFQQNIIRDELDKYNESIKDKPSIALLREVAISLNVGIKKKLKGGIGFALVHIGASVASHKVSNITLKFEVPKKKIGNVKQIALMQKQKI